jgi:hypothetical protein
MRHGAAQNEAARLDAGDLVDFAAGPWLHQLIDGLAEGARVAEQRGDVAEHDPGLGIVRDGAYGGLEVVFERCGSHGWDSSFRSAWRPDARNGCLFCRTAAR